MKKKKLSERVKLTQKKTCNDCAAGAIFGWYCDLGYKTKTERIEIHAFGTKIEQYETKTPLEPCPKPRTYSEYKYAKKHFDKQLEYDKEQERKKRDAVIDKIETEILYPTLNNIKDSINDKLNFKYDITFVNETEEEYGHGAHAPVIYVWDVLINIYDKDGGLLIEDKYKISHRSTYKSKYDNMWIDDGDEEHKAFSEVNLQFDIMNRLSSIIIERNM